MKKQFLFIVSVLTIHLAMFAVDQREKVLEQPMPPVVLKVTYPHSDPLKDALRPVPETAIFKMEGYYLWDPSLIKVGATYHLFCSQCSLCRLGSQSNRGSKIGGLLYLERWCQL